MVNRGELSFIDNVLRKRFQDWEEILIKNNIKDDSEFKSWLDDFKSVYSLKNKPIRLYVVSAFLYFFGKILLLNAFNENMENIKLKASTLDKLNQKLKSLLLKQEIPYLSYFIIFNKLENDEIRPFLEEIFKCYDFLRSLAIKPEYYFDFLFHELIPDIIRHKSGEFFTPPFLVNAMLNKCYKLGDSIFDPCCGSGNFLIEALKRIIDSKLMPKQKIKAINKIHGQDLNPISIYMAKINFIILLKEKINSVKLNLRVGDSLSDINAPVNIKYDLVVSNPPWYTYREIESEEYQESIKQLAEKLGIKPSPKNILNIEIAALFFYKSKDYIKEGGKLFFVITKGVMTGSHASRFRNFKGFSNLEIWTFEKKIERIYNIDFICLYAKKNSLKVDHHNYEIPNPHLSVKGEGSNLKYFDNAELVIRKNYTLKPYAISKEKNNPMIKKFIRKSEDNDLIPNETSIYKELFHKGADLNPRNLIFLNTELMNNSLVNVSPDERIFKRAKKPWKEVVFKNELLEQEYIFKVIKSTELVKFHIYDHYNVFLPITKNDLKYNFETLKDHAKKLWIKINTYYLKNKKTTTKHDSLMNNLNRWNKLSNKRQRAEVKVVYNNSGSILNAAVVQGEFIITGDLSFYAPDTLNEAYYLSAILNSNVITTQVKIRKSSRHIFKIPFELPIKRFDPQKRNHLKLVTLAKKGEQKTKSVINDLFIERDVKISKFKLQNILKKELAKILSEIDEIVMENLI